MLPYYRNPDSNWEWRLLGLAAMPRNEWGVLFLLLVMLSLAIFTIIDSTIKELYRVFRAHAFSKTRSAKVLWIALAALIVLWLIALLLITSGIPVGWYLGSWSVLVFVLIVEGCDWYESRRMPKASNTLEVDVREVLQPWSFSIQHEE